MKNKHLTLCTCVLLCGVAVVLTPLSISNFLYETYSLTPAENLWGKSVQEFKERNLGQYLSKKFIGKYYKVMLMGHRRVIEFSDYIAIKHKEVNSITGTVLVGDTYPLEWEEEFTYSYRNTVSTTQQVAIGISNMIEAAVNLFDIASVGTESKLTAEYTISSTKEYSESLEQTLRVTYPLSDEQILPHKPRYRYSQVACIVEMGIKKSYTQESRWIGGWTTLNNTIKQNYVASYYIDETFAYVYPNDYTFGNTLIGEFSLDEPIKLF